MTRMNTNEENATYITKKKKNKTSLENSSWEQEAAENNSELS